MRWPILTSKEKQVVGFIVFCVILGLAAKTYRASHPVQPVLQKQPGHEPRAKKAR